MLPNDASFLTAIGANAMAGVCRGLPEIDLITLSMFSTKHCDWIAFCNKKSRTIKNFQWKINGYSCEIDLNLQTAHNPRLISIRLAPATQQELKTLGYRESFGQFGGINVKYKAEVDRLTIYHPGGIVINQNTWMDKFTEHLLKLFSVESFRLYIHLYPGQEVWDCFVFRHTNQLATFVLDGNTRTTTVSWESMDFMLDFLNVDMFVMQVEAARGYRYNRVLRFKHMMMIAPYYPTWLTFENLKTMLCTSMVADGATFSGLQFNELVQDWLNGRNETLKLLRLEYRFDRSFWDIEDAKTGLTFRTYNDYPPMFENEFAFIGCHFDPDVVRADGKIACFINDDKACHFGVWETPTRVRHAGPRRHAHFHHIV